MPLKHLYTRRGDSLHPEYRPVSLSSILCKVIESIIRDYIMDPLYENSLLTPCQHGFVRGRSCITQLLVYLDDWTEMLDSGESIDVIYMDYAKAFVKVAHVRLLSKLEGYGITKQVTNWVQNSSSVGRSPVWSATRERPRSSPLHMLHQRFTRSEVKCQVICRWHQDLHQGLGGKGSTGITKGHTPSGRVDENLAAILQCQQMQDDAHRLQKLLTQPTTCIKQRNVSNSGYWGKWRPWTRLTVTLTYSVQKPTES